MNSSKKALEPNTPPFLIEASILPEKDGTPATMSGRNSFGTGPQMFRTSPLMPLSLPPHPITQQPVQSSVQRTSQPERGNRIG